MSIDTDKIHQYVKKISSPFKIWNECEDGIIDINGNILKINENYFGLQELMVLELKKIIDNLPENNQKLATYMAALHLVQECEIFTNSILIESVTEDSIIESLNLFLSRYTYYTDIIEEVNKNLYEAGGGGGAAGGVSAGSGAIAGLGVNPSGPQIGISPQGEPGVKKRQQLNYTNTNSTTKNRRPFRDILGSIMINRGKE